MKALEIIKDVYWVGAIDYNIRDFHGYTTPRGTTYNSYLITDEKTVLIDTVKSAFKDELINRISSVVDPREIDVLIVNHVEMEHSSSSVAIMNLSKKARVICTEKGQDFLHLHYHDSKKWNITTVGPEDKLEIGRRVLSFIPAAMLHWPDTMFTYSKADKTLFSNDGFGQHIATEKRFADEVRDLDILGEAKKYYANILMPYSSVALKKLNEIIALKLKFDIICPSHGVVFREPSDIKEILQAYASWASGDSKEKAVIAYDTMYNSTEKMARSITQGLNEEGIETRLYNLRVSELSDVLTEILDSRCVIVGSSTLNNGVLPTVGAFLTYLKGFRPRGKLGAAFGSFGWGGGAVKTITEELKNAGMTLPEEGFQIRFVPGPEVLNDSRELGKRMAKHIRGGST